MRFLVVMVSAGAAVAFIAASALMNWVFTTSLGRSEFEQNILGAVSVAVSAFLALLPTLVLWAWRERRPVYVVLGIPVFLGFAAFSLSSAVGFAAKNRGSLSEDRALAAVKLAGVKQELAEAETKLNTFGVLKPASVLRESLRGLEQDRRWQSSKKCTEATTDASRAFCKSYFEMKAEAAAADEKEHLEARIAELRSEARGLEDRGAGREADNQAAVLARVFGWQTAKVERGLMLFLAVLVEAGAALGLYFATGHMRPSSPSGSNRGRGARIIEGSVLQSGFESAAGPRTMKQIAGPVPRRVPRLKQS